MTAIYKPSSSPSSPDTSENGSDRASLSAETSAATSTATLQKYLDKTGLLKQPQVRQHWERVRQAACETEGAPGEVIQTQFRKQQKLVRAIARQLRSCESLNALLEAAVAALKKVLDVDRALVFRVNGGQNGKVAAEAMNVGYTPSPRGKNAAGLLWRRDGRSLCGATGDRDRRYPHLFLPTLSPPDFG